MFKNLWKYFKNDSSWKNIMKVCVIYSIAGLFGFWIYFILMLTSWINHWHNDKNIYWMLFFITESSFISYNLTIFVVNSNEVQQQKYRFLWLFLYFLALNPLGIISILLLLKKQKNKNDVIENKETSQIIKIEKWLLLWLTYSSIASLFFLIPIPIAIINLINIKRKWNNELIEIKELKKIIYFSSDLTLMLASKFAF